MKHLLIIFSLLLTSISWSEDGLISLEQYAKQNDIENDISAAYYFNARCTSLFVYQSDLMKTPEMKDMKAEFEMTGNMFYLLVSEIAKSVKGDWEKQLKETLITLINVYTKLGNDNYIQKGQYLTQLHLEDTRTCSNFIKNKM